MRDRATALILVVGLLCWVGPNPSAALYKWIDDDGNLHVATSLEDVPERYRDRVTVLEDGPSRVAPADATEPPPVAPPPGTDPLSTEAEAQELQRFEVRYENEGSSSRVIIPVTFNDRITAPMAVDTGSPGMLISFELAQRLGIFSRDSGTLFTEAAGIGGTTLAIRTIVDSVSVETARDEFVPTTVTAPLSDRFEGLIGMDFLANHTIQIDTRKQVVVFQETTPDPTARGGHSEAWWRKTFQDFRAARDYWRDLARTTNLRESSPYRAAIEFQAREAQRLYLRLDGYASDNAVPRHWR
jgi:hypothetical protein